MANLNSYLLAAFIFLVNLFACPSASAQPRGSREFAIHYRLDKIDIDSTYLDNAATIDTIRFFLNRSEHIYSITIYAWASPEGGFQHNKWLSEKRAAAAKDLLLSLVTDSTKLNEGKIKLNPLSENWPGLTELVKKNYHRQDRDKLLTILETGVGINEETLKWRIKQLDNGYTWDYLKRHYMTHLRSASGIYVWADGAPIAPLQEIKDELPSPKVVLKRTYEAPREVAGEFMFAAKTNLLGDVFTAVNLGIEVPIGKRFSVNAHYMFPWWAAGPYGNKYALQVLDLEGEFRWWFIPGKEKLLGHYLALQGRGGKFDLQWNRKFGCYQCNDWGVGLSYGYAMKLGKHLNMEFAFTLGYMEIDYQHYVPSPDWSVLLRDNSKVGTLHYFGPTSLKVSLVYPFHIQYKRRK